MASLNLLVAVSLIYVAFLFAVAFGAERAAMKGRAGWLRSPVVYTLSLSIYCTAWTFYGAVGYAARSGLEYLTIYIGPSIVMIGWVWALRKIVRIGRSQRITSVADLISSRYGKSNLLAVAVTLIAVVGTTPYIALQLQSVTQSVAAFAAADPSVVIPADNRATALWVAAGLAAFTVLFGTRNLDSNERHHGVVMAIALEAVVKLCALLAVGIFTVWGIGGGVGQTLARIDASAQLGQWQMAPGRWSGLIFLSGAALLCLPRMFQVLVVENEDERHLRTASWAFPAYMIAMSLFVMPIAVAGLSMLPDGANPDMFVLTLPLSEGRTGLAVFSFLGGFSSATSMVIVAAIALSTMVSNHIVMPIWLSLNGKGAMVSGDVRHVVIMARRVSIIGVLFLGYLYYRLSGGGTALAAIGLISFSGVVQFLPSMLGGIFWRGATRNGALAGLILGFATWLWCLFLPSFGDGVVLPAGVLAHGPWGIGWLRPYALFGITGLDPLVHGVLWSILLNTLAFLGLSIFSFPSPMERLQGAQFVNVYQHSASPRGWSGGIAQSEDLMIMAQRLLGAHEAQKLFQSEAARQGVQGYLPDPNAAFLQRLERELSGSVGAATAHAMVGQIVGGAAVSVEDLMAVADETAQIMEYSSQLEAKSDELVRTARQLRVANAKLTQLSVQKDAFLSQISHELRTPMTSIRAFSEIMRDAPGLTEGQKHKYANIIHDETVRLTRLLDDLLDLAVLENGQVSLNLTRARLGDILDHAVAAANGDHSTIKLRRDRAQEAIWLQTDSDRLAQVFINLIANAGKYCDARTPELRIAVRRADAALMVDFIDNGAGIETEQQGLIFEKFSRIGDQKAGGAGLGLAICREIMSRLGGSITYLPGQGGAAFRVTLPLQAAIAAQ
ncbi:sodium:solute symporter [Pseudooceanicola sediminis]|uniref:histidine kinase n=1 Tax=Pseudooceanicola sediminis TaxID=2211117 RepID=A0A399IX78_9RHOB|nr:ATP-binding protein [Pseudooceanicola sediminis]KAA2313151.1 sodium:solute symporter [Puniceibacterium sp. HSS470]RII37798.1 sodium:solute symporter [Pseudooceanicola sediminis]|tara:strand:+ start:98788 stop:101475 length:2688 start_codon:yes stop_codon:yes gene_type:complete